MMNSISTCEELRRGDTLFSPNKEFKVVFQEDSNFVVYQWSPIWASGTFKKDGFRILLQEDGNLVMYTKSDKAIWSTGTHVPNTTFRRMRLTLTNDGKLMLDNNGDGVWNSDENKGVMMEASN